MLQPADTIGSPRYTTSASSPTTTVRAENEEVANEAVSQRQEREGEKPNSRNCTYGSRRSFPVHGLDPIDGLASQHEIITANLKLEASIHPIRTLISLDHSPFTTAVDIYCTPLLPPKVE